MSRAAERRQNIGAGRADQANTPDLTGMPRREATEAERKALASVPRMRILRMCLYEELTNQQIADRLGRNPASVLHHVRTLVNQGFLVAGDPRSGPRGSREVPYRATGKSWRMQIPDERTNTLLRTFYDEVAAVPEVSVQATRLGLQLSPEHLEEFSQQIADVFEEFARRPLDPGGERLSVFFAIHPEPD